MAEKQITTGLELECAVPSAGAYPRARDLGISNREDGTIISDSKQGVEWVTPVLTLKYDVVEGREPRLLNDDYLHEWVDDLCSLADRVNQSCGLHQHLGKPVDGKSVWSADDVRTWLTVGYALEDHLFELCPKCRTGNGTCAPLAAVYDRFDNLLSHPAGLVDRNKRKNQKRYAWMNVIETKRRGMEGIPSHFAEGKGTGTVEIRMLGNTRRTSYIYAWANFWGKVAAYVAYYPHTSVTMGVLAGFLDRDLELIRQAKSNGVREAQARLADAERIRRRNDAVAQAMSPERAAQVQEEIRRRRARAEQEEERRRLAVNQTGEEWRQGNLRNMGIPAPTPDSFDDDEIPV